MINNKLKIKSIVEWLQLEDKTPVYNAENSEEVYTKARFIELCEGDANLAYELFTLCEWQCPETVIDQCGCIEAFRSGDF